MLYDFSIAGYLQVNRRYVFHYILDINTGFFGFHNISNVFLMIIIYQHGNHNIVGRKKKKSYDFRYNLVLI